MMSWRAWAVRRSRARAVLVAILFGVVALTCTVLAGSFGASALLADRAAQATLADPDQGDAGLQVQTRVGDDASAQDALVRGTIGSTFAPVPVTIWTTLLSEPKALTSEGRVLPTRVVLASAPQLGEPQLRLDSGSWAQGPHEATLQSAAAAHLGLHPGSVVSVAGVELTVTGTWQAVDPDAALWLQDPLMRSGSDGSAAGPLLTTGSVVSATGSAFIRWVVLPDVSSITSRQLPLLTERSARSAEALTAADVSGRGIVVTGDLGPIAERASREAARGEAFGIVPVTVLVLIAGVALSQVAGLLAAARETEDALLVARGVSLRQAMGVMLAESSILAVAGTLLGSAIAAAVLSLLGGRLDQVGGGVAAGGVAGGLLAWCCLAGVALRGALASFRTRHRSRDRVRRLAGAAILLLTVALAVVSTWQLRSGSEFVEVDRAGRARLDIISALSPALLLAAIAVLALVTLAPVTRLIDLAGRGTRAVAGWLASAQVARGLVVHAVAVVLTVLATGTATFAAYFAGTSAAISSDIAAATAGADLRAELATSPDLAMALPPVGEVAGVTSAVPVWRQDSAQVGDRSIPVLAAPVEGLDRIATLPTGSSLPPAATLRASFADTQGSTPLRIPAGARVTVTLGATVSLDAWQAAALAAYPEQARRQAELTGSPADLSPAGLDSALAGLRAPASASVDLLVRDPVTGLVGTVSSEPVTATPGPFVHGPQLSRLHLDPATAEVTSDLTLPIGGELDLDRITVRLSGQPTDSRTTRFTLAIAVNGTPLLGESTSAWSSDTAFPVRQAGPYRDAEAAATPATARLEEDVDAEGRPTIQTLTNAPDLPEFELDTTGRPWILTRHFVGTDGHSGAVIKASPLGDFLGTDPLQVYRPAAHPPQLIPVALTRATSTATNLAVGDRVDIGAAGTQIPGLVAAVIDTLPAVPGSLGVLIDSASLNRYLTGTGASVTAPSEIWAAVDGDPAAVRAAVAALPAIASVEVAQPPQKGSADIATTSMWVTAACAVALAGAGLAATVATMTSIRRPEVAVLRALGMSPREQAMSRASETGWVLTLAAALGIAGGALVADLSVGPVARTASRGVMDLPVRVCLDWPPLLALLALGAVIAGGIVAWQAGAVRRQALEIGYREEIR